MECGLIEAEAGDKLYLNVLYNTRKNAMRVENGFAIIEKQVKNKEFVESRTGSWS